MHAVAPPPCTHRALGRRIHKCVPPKVLLDSTGHEELSDFVRLAAYGSTSPWAGARLHSMPAAAGEAARAAARADKSCRCLGDVKGRGGGGGSSSSSRVQVQGGSGRGSSGEASPAPAGGVAKGRRTTAGSSGSMFRGRARAVGVLESHNGGGAGSGSGVRGASLGWDLGGEEREDPSGAHCGRKIWCCGTATAASVPDAAESALAAFTRGRCTGSLLRARLHTNNGADTPETEKRAGLRFLRLLPPGHLLSTTATELQRRHEFEKALAAAVARQEGEAAEAACRGMEAATQQDGGQKGQSLSEQPRVGYGDPSPQQPADGKALCRLLVLGGKEPSAAAAEAHWEVVGLADFCASQGSPELVWQQGRQACAAAAAAAARQPAAHEMLFDHVLLADPLSAKPRCSRGGLVVSHATAAAATSAAAVQQAKAVDDGGRPLTARSPRDRQPTSGLGALQQGSLHSSQPPSGTGSTVGMGVPGWLSHRSHKGSTQMPGPAAGGRSPPPAPARAEAVAAAVRGQSGQVTTQAAGD
jgi:hypothetical protein